MKIADQNSARNWAQKELKYPNVLVDEEGNIHCSPSPAHMGEVADQKTAAGKKFFIVKGALPVKPVKPTPDAK